MSRLRPYLSSLRFWLAVSATAAFTIGVFHASAASPTVNITTPASNQVIVGNQVEVLLDLTNFKTADYQKNPNNKLGQGHIHLWLDQTQPTPASAVKTSSLMYTFTNVKPGSHTLLVELVNNNHSSLSPQATASVNFVTQAPTPTTTDTNLVLWMAITAFMLVTAALFLVSPKRKSNSGQPAKKSGRKSTKKR